MLQIVKTQKMDGDNNSEKVAILDAGAQYGKVKLEISEYIDKLSLCRSLTEG